MHSRYSPPLLRHLRLSLAAAFVALFLLLAFTVGAFAATVNVYDNAGVLNVSQVQSAAAQLQYPLDIYTTNKFTGSKTVFGQQTDGKMRSGSMIIAIDTVNRYLWVDGQGVPLSHSQYQEAASSFASDFKSSSDYTSATVSAIHTLNNALGSTAKGSGATPAPVPVSGNGFNFGGLACCLGILVLAGLAVFGVTRMRRGGAGGFGGFGGFRRNVPPVQPYDPNYGQPYNQYGPGPYNQGGYPQRGGGMNPWAAGGLGAAAGGLVGYELGKDAGGDERRDDQGFNGGDQGNNYGGGGAGADFGGGGGGAGADFGGGGGGGGDFGGGGGGGGGAGTDF